MEDFAQTTARLAKLKAARAAAGGKAPAPAQAGNVKLDMVRAPPALLPGEALRADVELGRLLYDNDMRDAGEADRRRELAERERNRHLALAEMARLEALRAEEEIKQRQAQKAAEKAEAERRAAIEAAEAAKRAEERRAAIRAENAALGLPDSHARAEAALDQILSDVSAQQEDMRRSSESNNAVMNSAKRRARRRSKLTDDSLVPAAGDSVAPPAPRRTRTAMIFTLPSRFGTYDFVETGRRLLLLRSVKHIDLWQHQFDYTSIVIALFTDIAFLANKVEDGVFELIHRPTSRANVTATEAPPVYGPKAIKVAFGKDQHLLVASSVEEARFWLKRLNQFAQ